MLTPGRRLFKAKLDQIWMLAKKILTSILEICFRFFH